jgi:drug/metabolite transporter (DMT)-like permease
MPLALLLLGAVRPRLILGPAVREHAGGLLLGGVFFAGFTLQTWGLAWTTPALSAFFTCLCSVWMPPLAWLLLRERLVPLVLLGLGVAVCGCAVLVEGQWRLGRGELLTLLASFLFAGQMLLLNALGKDAEPAHLSAGFLAGTGLLAWVGVLVAASLGPGLPAWWAWTEGMLRTPEVLRSVVCLAILPTALAFHWMNSYQPQTPPGRAALIYLLEPVFSSVFSVWWGYDDLTVPLVAGGVLILAGNLLVEAPRWLAFPRPAR